jgi:hypothetical protein
MFTYRLPFFQKNKGKWTLSSRRWRLGQLFFTVTIANFEKPYHEFAGHFVVQSLYSANAQGIQT